MTVPEVYRIFWRYRLLIAALTIVAVAGAWYLTKREQPVYTAGTLVRVQQRIDNPTDAFGALETGGRLAQTYVAIVATTTIAHRVYRQLDGEIPYSAIAGSISGSQVDDLELMNITATSTNPAWAARIANATPRALRGFIHQTGTLKDQVITVEQATVPRAPSSPNKKMNLALALIIGLAFNCGLALLVEFIRDRVHEPEELERLMRKPVLATIPTLRLSTAGVLRGDERSRIARLRARVRISG